MNWNRHSTGSCRRILAPAEDVSISLCHYDGLIAKRLWLLLVLEIKDPTLTSHESHVFEIKSRNCIQAIAVSAHIFKDV